MNLGIISDTHGKLYKQALNALQGADMIIHAGDVGSPSIIAELAKIAPVTAVRGNTDSGPWAGTLLLTELIQLEGRHIYVVHDLSLLDLDPSSAGIHIVISGHTHQPMIRNAHNVLYFNPGSASQKRHGGPLSVGRIYVSPNELKPEIIHLDG